MPNVPVPGDMEGFGIVMLEAGLCGTPAIAARLEGIQDVITEGVNGHLVEPEQPEAFASSIRSYVDAPERLRRLSTRARQHTVETFGWEAVAQTYLQRLQHLHATGRPSERTAAPEWAAASPRG
jgi:phosphatidylinositol alpha-1,6-mannosyltransferase